MWLVFTISQVWVGPWVAEVLDGWIGAFAGLVEGWLSNAGTGDFLTGFILEGVIGGFAAVVGFLPLIMVLFFLLSLMEDSGYMARVALLMDRYFKKIGLAGKSIIPMYVGTACSIPAVMSAKTIKNEKQRRMTVLLTPFIPCGAKLPVIALFIGVFFTEYSYMTALTYLIAILVIYIAGQIVKNITGADYIEDESSAFIVELPEYKVPSLKTAFFTMLERAKAFIIKAATIIILMNGIVWLLTNFDFSFSMVENTDASMLKVISTPFAWLMTPLGFGIWGLAAAAVLGFVAKEEVVGALAVIFAFSVNEDFEISSIETTRQVLMSAGGLTAVSAFAYLLFNLFTPPCFAAIGAMNSELGSRKWTIFAVGLQLVIGYVVAMIAYQVGTLVFYGQLGEGFIVSIIVLAVFIGLFVFLKNKASKGEGLAKIG